MRGADPRDAACQPYIHTLFAQSIKNAPPLVVVSNNATPNALTTQPRYRDCRIRCHATAAFNEGGDRILTVLSRQSVNGVNHVDYRAAKTSDTHTHCLARAKYRQTLNLLVAKIGNMVRADISPPACNSSVKEDASGRRRALQNSG
jgi:hypothetical protein